jgi:hypothetical protein
MPENIYNNPNDLTHIDPKLTASQRSMVKRLRGRDYKIETSPEKLLSNQDKTDFSATSALLNIKHNGNIVIDEKDNIIEKKVNNERTEQLLKKSPNSSWKEKLSERDVNKNAGSLRFAPSIRSEDSKGSFFIS